jgi:hypothetical protein
MPETAANARNSGMVISGMAGEACSRRIAAPASPDSPNGLASSGAAMSPGYTARKTMMTAHQATMVQATGRQRGDGGSPLGNHSSRSAKAARAGQGIQLPTQPTTAAPGSGLPVSSP